MKQGAPRLQIAACAAVMLAAAIACGGTGGSSPHVAGAGGHPAASATPASAADRTRVSLQFASCLRAHGVNEPDPSFDANGNPTWQVDPKQLSVTATGACSSILQAANVQPPHSAPTAAQLAQATHLAQCLRQHGIADFPDPDPQTGQFPTTHDPRQEPGWAAAQQACQQFEPQGKSGS
jgi:hypothetical protein